MKKLLTILLFLIPVLCFAQSGGQRSLKTKSENIVHTDFIGVNDSSLIRVDSNGNEHSLKLGNGLNISNDSLRVIYNNVTNLSYTSSPTTGTVNSDTGTDAIVPAATTSIAGLLTASDKSKLNGLSNYEYWDLYAQGAHATNIYSANKVDIYGSGLISASYSSVSGVDRITLSSTADAYEYWILSGDAGGSQSIVSHQNVTFTGTGGITTTQSSGTIIIDGSSISGGSGYWQSGTGYIAPTTISNEVRVGSISDMGSYIFQVTGNSRFAGTLTSTSTMTATNFILSSDRRLKKNICQLYNLNWIDDVNFYSFMFKNDNTNTLRYGVIAQELEKIAPELVSTSDDGTKAVSYTDFLVAKVARQDQQIKDLQRQIDKLEKLILQSR